LTVDLDYHIVDVRRSSGEQGTKMGRRSLLRVMVHGKNGSDGIDVGGNARHIATGSINVTLRT
jgi:predicted PhzF superfamily epimerase YddE/YHI9